MTKYTLHRNSRLVKVIRWFRRDCVAVTLWSHIYMAGISLPDWVIRHEVCHVEQFKRYGGLWFFIRYIWLTIRHGYYDNPMEVEARNAEKRGY